MCGPDCKPALRCPRTVCIPFAANRNLSGFWANTKRTGCARCPFHATGILCSPQVRGKLINDVPNTLHANGAMCKRHARVYKALHTSSRQEQITLLLLVDCLPHGLVVAKKVIILLSGLILECIQVPCTTSKQLGLLCVCSGSV